MNTAFDITNEIIQHAIDDLVSLDIIPAIDKAHLLLTANGNKPSMHTGFFTEPIAIGQDIFESDINIKNTFVGIITDLGLAHKIETKVYDEMVDGVASYSNRIVFCVAKDMNTVNKLFDAREKGDDKTEGILLGFPDSAVEAYISDNLLDIASRPVSTTHVTVDEMKLLNHRLSKDNWEDEVSYLPEYARAIKLLSPEIYDQCMSE